MRARLVYSRVPSPWGPLIKVMMKKYEILKCFNFYFFSVFFCSAFNNFLGKLNIPYLALPFNIISRPLILQFT